MKNLKQKKIKYIGRTIILPLGFGLLLLFLLFFGIQYYERVRQEQEINLTEQSIRKATIQCYANEGLFPAQLSYLEENYGLLIDYSKYYVIYEAIASNLMPEIAVYQR